MHSEEGGSVEERDDKTGPNAGRKMTGGYIYGLGRWAVSLCLALQGTDTLQANGNNMGCSFHV